MFETLAIRGGRILDWSAHRARLLRSLECLKIEGVVTACEALPLERWSREVVERFGDGSLKIMVSMGDLLKRSDFEGFKLRTILTHRPLEPFSTPSLSLSEHRVCYPLGIAKWTGMIAVHLAFRRECRTDDCLLLSNDGHVAEATTSNVFFLISGEWMTPDSHRLDGVTRLRFLDYIRSVGLRGIERKISLDLARESESIVLTNSGLGAIAVKSLDGRELLVDEDLCDSFRRWWCEGKSDVLE